MNNTLRKMLYENNKETSETDEVYPEILRRTREHITREHSDELALSIADKSSAGRLKLLISAFLSENELRVSGHTADALTERIYADMAGLGFLERYIYDDSVEEINGNAWNDVEVVRKDGWLKLKEGFASPEQAADTVKKMVRLGGLVLDNTNPAVDSFLTEGIRISAVIPPVTDRQRGAVFSLRKQRKARITREELLSEGTASAELLDFLTLCVNNGVSIGIAGKTGSGKTTDISFILNSADSKLRIFTIEETRELDLVNDDENGRPLNRVIHTCIRPSELENADVDMNDLLRLSLRFHPDILVLSEMRGGEAMTVVESARTGHTVVTSLHANSAEKAYNRILSMCQMAKPGLPADVLLSFIVEAFPVMMYKKQLKDGRRIITEVVEATGVRDNRVQTETLFTYENGRHRRASPISQRLVNILIENDAAADKIWKLRRPREWHTQ